MSLRCESCFDGRDLAPLEIVSPHEAASSEAPEPLSASTPLESSVAPDGIATSVDELRRRAIGRLATLPPAALELSRLFDAEGYEFSLVGGSVRDIFLGRPFPDLDFTTSARPDVTRRILKVWGDSHWDVGQAYGTIGARKGDVVVDVTTYRTEVYTEYSRKPEVAFGDSLEGDLLRRDFAVNAMAVRLPELTFIDPFDGLVDLSKRLLRTPGKPEESFDEDPLRMMRAARFASQLGFTVAPEAFKAITEMADRISIVSAERVQAELVKLVMGRFPRRGLNILVDSGLADHVLPELPAMRLEIDEHHRHKDVYEHSLTVLDQAIDLETGPDGAVPGPDLVLRLAALLHDIGKPPTRRFEDGGGVSFHHHEVVGAKMVARRMKALKFDKETTVAVARLVELHLRFHGYGEGGWTDSAVRRYVTDAGPLLERLHRLTRSDCTTRNKRKAARLSGAYDDLETRIAELREKEELASIRPELDGEQIMSLLSIAPGREVGAAYAFLLELRMEGGPIGEDAAREALLKWWAERGA